MSSYDYVREITNPTSILMWAYTDDPNYVFDDQFDPAIFEETKSATLPKDWTQSTYYDVMPNIMNYIASSTSNQGEMYVLVAPIQSAIANGDYAVAQDIVNSSTLSSGQKSDINSFIIPPYVA